MTGRPLCARILLVAALGLVGACRAGGLPAPDFPETVKVDRPESKTSPPVELISVRYEYRLDGRGGFVRTFRQRYRVLTEQGVNDWSSTQASWSPWYMERPELAVTVTSASGATSTLDPATVTESAQYPEAPDVYSDARVLRAPLPNVKVGSVVDEAITTRTRQPFLGNAYAHSAVFQAGVPIGEVDLVIDAPADAPLKFEVRDAKVTTEDTREGGRRRLRFHGGPYPALTGPEPLVPSDVPPWPHVAFSDGPSWRPLVEAYARLVDDAMRDAPFSGVVEKTVKRDDDPKVKADKLLDWIKKRVRYAGIEFGDSAVTPQKPTETLKRGYGDCKDQAVLLAALLREAGVPARVALLHAGLDDDIRNDLPALNVFNHAIVVVPGASPMWIDPTADQARAGELPGPDQGRLALVIDPDTKGLTRTPLPDVKDNGYRETRVVHLPEHGFARIVETSTSTGFIERQLRRQLLDAGKDLGDGLGKYVHRQYNTTTLGAYEASPVADLSVPFKLSVEAKDAHVAVSNLSGAAILVDPDVLFSWVPPPLQEGDERRAELALPTPYEAELRYEIRPPEGFVPDALPKLEDLALGPAKLARAIAPREGGAVEVRYRFALPKARWSAAEVSAFRKAFAALREETHPQVSFIHEGQKLARERRPAEALDLYRRAMKAHPQGAIHKARYAATLADLGFAGAARKAAAEAAKLEPEVAIFHSTLGQILERDAFGRSLHKGFDRQGALAAFREAVKRAPDDMDSQVRIGILLEHDDDGVRYGDPKRLGEAVSHYDGLDQDKLAAHASGEFVNNVLFALMYAGRFADLRARLAKLPKERVPHLVAIVAASAVGGPNEGLAEAVRLGVPRESRAEILDGAAGVLLRLRKYPEAAALTESVAAESSDASLRMRAQLQKKLRVVDPAALPATKPEDLVAKAVAAFASEPAITDAQARAYVSARAWNRKGSASMVEVLKGLGGDTAQRVGITAAGMADLLTATWERTVDGSASVGYRVSLRPSFGAGQALRVFVARDGAGWKLRATDGIASELGCEALHLAKGGDKKAATQWLEWAFEIADKGSGDDPLRGDPFARLWAADKREVEVAAATLCADGAQADQAIATLDAARGKGSPTMANAVLEALWLAQANLGQLKEALAAAERLEKAVPGSLGARYAVDRSLARLERYDAILARLKPLLSAKPDDDAMIRILADTEDALGHAAEAYRLGEKLLASGKATIGDYNNQAWRSIFTGTVTDKDLGYALRAAQAAPGDAAYLNTLAAVYAEMGRTEDARETLLKILPLEPRGEPRPADWYVVGRVAERLSLTDEARAAYAKVPKPERTWSATAWSLAQKRLRSLSP